MEMKELYYPTEYIKASKSSLKAQRLYKKVNLINLLILLIVTIMVSIDDHALEKIKDWHVITGGMFLLAGGCLVYLFFSKPELKWYMGRAVAESIKAISWKFMMNSEPFNSPDEKANQLLLLNTIKKITEKAGENGFSINVSAPHDEWVTQRMIEVSKMNYLEKKALYSQSRLDDQITWYRKKALFNKGMAIFLAWLMIIFLTITALYIFYYAKVPHITNVPEVTIFLVTAMIAIMEMNKYRELKESYSYTYNELRYIRSRIGIINDDEGLNEFVNDAEMAISREHTMWLARRIN